jgi:hypothetical protein
MLAGIALAIVPTRAFAQAFLPPPGEGSVTCGYQNARSHGHWDWLGDRMSGESGQDATQTHAYTCGIEFGLSRRVAVDASLPYIKSRYEGSAPHKPGNATEPREWDNGSYHGTLQDVLVGVRVNVVTGPIAFTPFTRIIIPSHKYADIAHAAPGKRLVTLVTGATIGGFLDSVLPGLYFQAQGSYAITEEFLDIRPNHSRLDSEIGYFITPWLAVRFIEGYQVTHRGLDLIGFTDMTDGYIHGTLQQISNLPNPGRYRSMHDRLQRSNLLDLGAGIDFAVNDSVQLFAAGANTVWGESVHPLRAWNVGVTWHFRVPWPGARERSRN